MHPLGPAPVLEHVAPSWVLKMGMGSPPLGGTPWAGFPVPMCVARLAPSAWAASPLHTRVFHILGAKSAGRAGNAVASPQQCR